MSNKQPNEDPEPRSAADATPPPFRIVGTAQRRVDALGKVTGAARFAADYNVAHQLCGKVLRAKHPHARICRIDVTAARQLAGVEAVLTAADIPGRREFGVVVRNQAILASDKVRYLGDGVALVAARTEAIAEEALGLIAVAYEPLPVVSDPETALQPGAPRLHEDGNTCIHHKVRRGDVQQGFAEAEVIVERTFRTPFVEHAYLEPEAVLAEPGEHGGIRIVGSIQNLFSSRRSVAAALALDLNRVELVQATLGGSFGGKDEVMTSMCCRAGLLALRTGRPVKMVNSREESMLESYKRHPYTLHYKWGAKRDGTLTAMAIRCVADAGAYASMTPFVTWRSVVQATGPYTCANVQTDVMGVYTNNNYTGAMRGFGAPQVNFAIESMMDELAAQCGLNPLDIRLQNGFERGAVTATGQRLDHNVSLKEVLRKAADAADFQGKWRAYAAAPQGERRRGIGLACSYRGVSLGAEGTDAAGAIVSVQTDGSVIVSSGITDMGQGAQTQMSQIAAEVLGIGMGRVRFLNTHTSRVPDSGPTVASRGTIMGGSAAKRAAESVRDTLLDVGADLTALPRAALDLREDFLVRVVGDGATQRLATFSELAAETFQRGKPMFGFGWHQAPKATWHEETGQGDAYFTFVYGCNVAEVEVDMVTGKVEVLNFVSCHDVGQAISRSGVLAQIYGGVAMGLGYGLFEDFEIAGGVPKQFNFDEYLIPTAMDMPRIIPIVIENPDAAGPFGAKSIGEPSNELAAPAILNAICQATGRRILELPATLERVLLGRKLTRAGARGSERSDAGQTWTDASCKVGHKVGMKPFEYIRAATLPEALETLARFGSEACVLAGGTDLLLLEFRRPGARMPKLVLDIANVAELRGIVERDGTVVIGALTTHAMLLRSELLRSLAPLLPEAAAGIGSPQVRNRGTLGGNIMNAAACADTVPPLVALEGVVTLASAAGVRELPLAALFAAPYRTHARHDELLTSLRFPKLPEGSRSAFLKLGRRKALSITRLSVAVVIARDTAGAIRDARIVPGAAFPVWRRVPEAEAVLLGAAPSPERLAEAGAAASAAMVAETGRRWLTPYKEPVLAGLVRRALEEAVAV